MKLWCLLSLCILVLSCSAKNSAKTPTHGTGLDCATISSSKWQAQLKQDSKNESVTLHVTGEIEADSLGYAVKFVPGPMDRRTPPSLRIQVKLEKSGRKITQKPAVMPVSFQMISPVQNYRSIIIFCDDKILTEINNVTFKSI